MRKHLFICGIWTLAVLVLMLVHWPAAALSSFAVVSAVSPLSSPAASGVQRAQHGKTLFMAKGCATCHTHAGMSAGNNRPGFAPDLTHYRANQEFLQRWLSNPQAVRPNTPMPNLNLTQDEIDALIAFLSANAPR